MVVQHDGGGGWRSDYESDLAGSGAGDPGAPADLVGQFMVDPEGLVSYGSRMIELVEDAASVFGHLMEMADPIQAGLAGAPQVDPYHQLIEPVPEAMQVAQTLSNRQAEFGRFLEDVTNGVFSIGNAAMVVAEIYHDSDGENAAGIRDVSFAFADREARPPDGFREHELLSEAQRDDQAAGDQLPMAAAGDTSMATRQPIGYWDGGHAVSYRYPDGSTRMVVVTTGPGEAGQSDVRRTTTTIRGADGTELHTTTEETYTEGTDDVHRLTVTRGGGEETTTTTTTHQDGSQTIQTDDGEETTLAPDERQLESTEPGPLQEVMERFLTEEERMKVSQGYPLGY